MKRGRAQQASGFTLVEVMIASALFGLIMAAAMGAFIFASRMSRAGGYQVQFTAKGRSVSQRITRYIEEGKAVEVGTSHIEIMMPNLTAARVHYVDADGNPDTVVDNSLNYDPDVNGTGGEVILCTHVTPISGEPMFALTSGSKVAVKMSFHIGDGNSTKHASFSGTGLGYQGVEVRLSATPRNVQRWYDS